MAQQFAQAAAAAQCKCTGCSYVKCLLIPQMILYKYITEFKSKSELLSVRAEHCFSERSDYDALVLRVKAYARINPFVPKLQLIAKLIPSSIEESVPNILIKLFKNEVMFYRLFKFSFYSDILPTTYIHEETWTHDEVKCQPPIIVMEDLCSRGYTQCQSKLDVGSLIQCVRCLASFHIEATRWMDLFMHNEEEYRLHLTANAPITPLGAQIRECKAINAFVNGPVMKALDGPLQTKIKRKLNNRRYLSQKQFVIHGAFTRSKIFIKEVEGHKNIKLINFQHVKLGSPAIDFGRILLTNLPNESNILSLEFFCRNLLENYMYQMKYYFASISPNLRKDIIADLPFSYINLDETELQDIEHHVPLMHVLNRLGSFN